MIRMDLRTLKVALAGLPIPAVRFYPSIGSTNDDALGWAQEGAEDLSLVAADLQTSGRGRMGRRWVTTPGASLAFTLVLRPSPGEMKHTSLFSPLGALAVASALEELGLETLVKWPNDVLLKRRKVCGILGEASWNGDRLGGLALGIGVNVAPDSVPPDDEVIYPATCVEAELDRPVERERLLARIVHHLLRWRPALGGPAFQEAWQARLAFMGEAVTVSPPHGDAIHGQVAGVDREGNLILVLPGGGKVNIAAGDVHLRPAEENHRSHDPLV